MAQQWWETVLACTDPTDTAAVHLASNALEEGLRQVVGDPSMVQAMLERPWLCTRAALCDTPGGRAFVAQLREQLTCLPVPTSLTAVDGTEVCGPADLRTTLGVLARVSHDDYFAVFEFCQRAYFNFLDRALSSGTATLQSLVFSAAQLPMDPCLQVLLDALQRTPEFASGTFEGRCQILGALYSDALAQLDFPSEEGWACGGGVPSSVGALRALEAPEPWFEIVCVTPSTVEAWYNNVLVPVWEGLRGLDVRDVSGGSRTSWTRALSCLACCTSASAQSQTLRSVTSSASSASGSRRLVLTCVCSGLSTRIAWMKAWAFRSQSGCCILRPSKLRPWWWQTWSMSPRPCCARC